MLLVVVVVFFFCNVLAFIVNVLELFHIAINELTVLNNFLVTVNSSVNFIIYCIFGQKFRHSFLKVLFCGSVPRCLGVDIASTEPGGRVGNNSTYGDRMSYSIGRNTQSIRMSNLNGGNAISHQKFSGKNEPLLPASRKEQYRHRATSLTEQEEVLLEHPMPLTEEHFDAEKQ